MCSWPISARGRAARRASDLGAPARSAGAAVARGREPHANACRRRYAFGECYYEVTKDQAEELLDSRKEKTEADSKAVEDEIATIKGTLAQLKKQLYGRFGKNINLEENPSS